MRIGKTPDPDHRHAYATPGERVAFWSSGQEWDSKSPENNPSAFVKLVFGSDTSVEEGVGRQYRALFEACSVPKSAQKLILGGTLANLLNLPE